MKDMMECVIFCIHLLRPIYIFDTEYIGPNFVVYGIWMQKYDANQPDHVKTNLMKKMK